MKKKQQEEATEVKQPRKLGLKSRLTLFALKLAALLALCVWVGGLAQEAWHITTAQATQVYETVLDKLTVTKVVTEVKAPDEATLREILDQSSRKHGIDPIILHVVTLMESSGGKLLYRFEPELYSRLLSKYEKRYSSDEIRMLASSHGITHVLGETAMTECDTHWSRLYDPQTAADCSARFLRRLWDRHSGVKNAGDRLWETFRAYNGSGPKAEAYADHAVRTLNSLLYKGMVAAKDGK